MVTVRLGEPRVEDGGERVVRTATVEGSRGATSLQVDVPARLAGPLDDASPLLGLALWPAVLAGTDVFVDGPVHAATLAGARRAAHVLRSWMPGVAIPAFDAAEVVQGGGTGRSAVVGTASYFSRGVDSLFEAALDTAARPPLTHLVFLDGIEPRHSPAVAAGEVAQASAAAEALGLPLAVVRTDAHALTGHARDWADVHGAVLASLATMLGGELDEVVIPSTDSYGSLVPYGSHPLLDPLLSTPSLLVRHGDLAAGRASKVAAIAEQRPDLLPFLKVCYAEDRVDNCGRCGKCTITMAALAAVGALEQATGFPDTFDLGAIRAMRPAPLQSRWHWVDVLRLLDATGREPALRGAIADALRAAARPPWRRRAALRWEHLRGRRPSSDPSWKDPARGIDWAGHTEVLRILTEGRSGRLGHPLPELPERLRPR